MVPYSVLFNLFMSSNHKSGCAYQYIPCIKAIIFTPSTHAILTIPKQNPDLSCSHLINLDLSCSQLINWIQAAAKEITQVMNIPYSVLLSLFMSSDYKCNDVHGREQILKQYMALSRSQLIKSSI